MFRKEIDSLGNVMVPSNAYYGAQTMRAIKNFPISGRRLQPSFIKSQGIIKKAAALANIKLEILDREIGNAIVEAAEEVIQGKFNDHFVLDVYQMGAGTSQNMNANEVIANRAIETLGGKKGDYSIVHPNDHVNMAQSTNDTIHGAINISALLTIEDNLLPAIKRLQRVLGIKKSEFSTFVKIGRTHLQDAVPITLGQEFGAYEAAIDKSIDKISQSIDALNQLNIGGTAVGSGINAHKQFSEFVISEINSITKHKFIQTANYFEMGQNTLEALELSGSLRYIAVVLGKIASDLIFMSSGPRAGIGEITLPPVQPGSSIMPGKINPSMAEMLNMICHQVIGNDTTVASACRGAQMELNVNMPVIAWNILDSIEILGNGIRIFSKKCIEGIKCNAEHCKELAEMSTALVTALSPKIGYTKATELAKEAYRTDKKIKDLAIEKGILSESEADEILNPKNLV